MRLDLDSLTAKLYRWFYNDQEMPVDGCYYIKYVLLMYLFIVPASIFCIPYYIVRFLFIKDKLNTSKGMIPKVLGSIVIYIMSFVFLCMASTLSFFFVSYNKGDSMIFFGCIGIFLWAFFICISFINLLEALSLSDKNIKEKSNLFTKFCNAKKEKYCPKIEWINNKNSIE